MNLQEKSGVGDLESWRGKKEGEKTTTRAERDPARPVSQSHSREETSHSLVKTSATV